jgi:hypothetical protein
MSKRINFDNFITVPLEPPSPPLLPERFREDCDFQCLKKRLKIRNRNRNICFINLFCK